LQLKDDVECGRDCSASSSSIPNTSSIPLLSGPVMTQSSDSTVSSYYSPTAVADSL